jgi:hypothetical protein
MLGDQQLSRKMGQHLRQGVRWLHSFISEYPRNSRPSDLDMVRRESDGYVSHVLPTSPAIRNLLKLTHEGIKQFRLGFFALSWVAVLLPTVSGLLPPQGRNRNLESPAGSRDRSPHRKAHRQPPSGTELPSGDRGVLAPNRYLFACPVPSRVKRAPTLVLRAMHGGFPRAGSPWPVTQSGNWLSSAGNIPATKSIRWRVPSRARKSPEGSSVPPPSA